MRLNLTRLLGDAIGPSLPSARILGHEIVDDVTFFRLRCSFEANGTSQNSGVWDVLRRYNEFDELRRQLRVRPRRVGCPFPTKTGLFRCKGNSLVERQLLLQTWLTGLLEEFNTSGDGRHAVFSRGKGPKVAMMLRFLGVGMDGRLQGDACVVGPPCVDACVPATASDTVGANVAEIQASMAPAASAAAPPRPASAAPLPASLPASAPPWEPPAAPCWEGGAEGGAADEEDVAVYVVDVPPGLSPGDEFVAEISAAMPSVMLTVPPGAPAVLHFAVPTRAAEEATT